MKAFESTLVRISLESILAEILPKQKFVSINSVYFQFGIEIGAVSSRP